MLDPPAVGGVKPPARGACEAAVDGNAAAAGSGAEGIGDAVRAAGAGGAATVATVHARISPSLRGGFRQMAPLSADTRSSATAFFGRDAARTSRRSRSSFCSTHDPGCADVADGDAEAAASSAWGRGVPRSDVDADAPEADDPGNDATGAAIVTEGGNDSAGENPPAISPSLGMVGGMLGGAGPPKTLDGGGRGGG